MLRKFAISSLGQESGFVFIVSPLISELLWFQASEITVDSFENASDFTSKWQFALFELAGSHYAAICRGIPTEGKDSIL